MKQVCNDNEPNKGHSLTLRREFAAQNCNQDASEILSIQILRKYILNYIYIYIY